MYTLHATQKLRDRLSHGTTSTESRTTTALGNWHATVLFWRPQVALFVDDVTLLPVLVAFAPAATLLDRFPAALADLLRAHEIPRSFVEPEIAAMATYQVAKTTSRSVLGSMNEFAYLAGADRADDPNAGLVERSLQLAETPCGPLFKRHVTPADELRAFVAQLDPS